MAQHPLNEKKAVVSSARRGFLASYKQAGAAAPLARSGAAPLREAVLATELALCVRGTFIRATLGNPDVDALRDLVLSLLGVRAAPSSLSESVTYIYKLQ